MSVAFLSHSDCGLHDTGWEHPEHVGRLRAIPSALKYHPDLFFALQHLEGRHATAAELALVHDAAYIARVEALAKDGGGRLDPDTVVSSGSWLAATAAVSPELPPSATMICKGFPAVLHGMSSHKHGCGRRIPIS
jgi:acetoin utilization deacetylase AcuC-like enzyme